MMEKGILLQNVLDEVFGFGPLGPLLRDPSVGDICVNGCSAVYVERHGRLEKTNIVFENERHLRQTIDKIIQPLGRRLDDNSPMVDARLPNGSRVNATIPPVSIDGPRSQSDVSVHRSCRSVNWLKKARSLFRWLKS